MKSRSILFLIFVHHVYASPGDECVSYEPLMKLFDNGASILKTFPFKDIRSHENEIVEKYLCPAESEESIAIIEDAAKYDYRLKYCLFEKKFQENDDRVCKKEVNFVFHKITKRPNQAICGSTRHQTAYTFSYYDCGELSANVEYLQNMKNKNGPRTYEISGALIFQHEMCYDTAEKSVLWTIHRIRTSQLFQNPHFKNQQPLSAAEISTKSYFMDDDTFLILKNRYEWEQRKNASEPGTFIMLPQPLVSPDHYALPIMKKATHHYINMAPLWEKLVPLATAIDQGIKQAELILESIEPMSYDPSVIFTKVTLPQEIEKIPNKRIDLQLFRENLWYKLVYRGKMKEAVLIIIHNTPGNPPENGRGCIIGTSMECNFQTWSQDENLSERITSEDTKYASCCYVTADEAKSLFSYDFEIKEYLDIDYTIANEDDSLMTNL